VSSWSGGALSDGALSDVAGLAVGHATLASPGWLTGTTVVLAPAEGAVAGVDVRGGGPGTRETDLLSPLNAVERVNAIVLSGGSAYGLAAADGVMRPLAALGRGVRVGAGAGDVVPIVPAAILFDLGRGGEFTHYPDAACGTAAFDAAMSGDAAVSAGAAILGGTAGRNAGAGNIGAGTGAVAGNLKGGTGSASVTLPGGEVVAALAVVNSVGSVASPRTGELYGVASGLPGEFDWLRAPSPAELSGAAGLGLLADRRPRPPLNTTIGVVATNVALTKAQCTRLAGAGHDGLARAIRPAHTMFDGDTIFGLSVPGSDSAVSGPAASGSAASGSAGSAVLPLLFYDILAAAADCFCRAIVHAVLSASSVTTPAGSWPAYLDAFPSAGTRPAR
jgi:L-aminopeptidase/D-esterase-like protein